MWSTPLQLLPLLLVLGPIVHGAASQQLCRPQGLLRLEQPFSAPQLQALPFCSQYKCSCCRPSHALAVKRSLLKEADSMSQPCMEALETLACRVCDPEVGIGAKPAVCTSTCDSAYKACRDDFFGWQESSGLVVPCGGRHAQLLVCSKLSEVANSGAEFCKASGYEARHDQPCFDGSYVDDDLCPEREPPVRPKRQRRPKSLRSIIQAQLDRIDLRVLAAVVVVSSMVAMACFRLALTSQQLQGNDSVHAPVTQEEVTAEQRREQLLRAVNERLHTDSPRSSSGGSDYGVSLIGSGNAAQRKGAKKRR